MASLRDEMPDTAEAIDQLREVFGAELINTQIKSAMNGMATFYAEEGDKTFGVKPLANVSWSSNLLIDAYYQKDAKNAK